VLSHVRLSWGAAGLLIGVMSLGGCGGKAAAKTSTSEHVQAARSAPAYRVGQYCLSSKEAKYRAAGLTCRRHHLAKH